LQTVDHYNDQFKRCFKLENFDLDHIYLEHYDALHRYAFTILKDDVLAEEMIHQVFLKLLEWNTSVTIHTSLKAYLYRAVNHECLNYLKHQKIKRTYQLYVNTTNYHTETPSGQMIYKELEKHIWQAINELPEQRRTIFQLSRFEQLKYAEIANQLGLSIKTIESQMRKALQSLRKKLADYLPILVWIILDKIC
jgi:RNA polymerase sigma-70 factor, ECF subfamily